MLATRLSPASATDSMENALADFRLCIDGKSSGAVRVSVGLASNFADVYRFLEFARGFVDRRA